MADKKTETPAPKSSQIPATTLDDITKQDIGKLFGRLAWLAVGIVVICILFIKGCSTSKSPTRPAAEVLFPGYNPQPIYCEQRVPHDFRLENRSTISYVLPNGCHGDRDILPFSWADFTVQFQNPQPGDYVDPWCTEHNKPFGPIPYYDYQGMEKWKKDCFTPQRPNGRGGFIPQGLTVDFSAQGKGILVLVRTVSKAPPRPPSLFD